MLKPLLLLPVALMVMAAPQFGTAQNSGKGEVSAHIKKLYEVDCALCHGAKGDGKTDLAASLGAKIDDWTDPNALTGKTDEQLFDIIRKGKDKMPPEDASRAKNDDVHGLINYIRSMSKGAPAAPAAAPAAAPGTN